LRALAAAYDISTIRVGCFVKGFTSKPLEVVAYGPLSVTFTSIDLLLERFVIRNAEPIGKTIDAAVNFVSDKGIPLAVLVPPFDLTV
jgi:hypothetical protein